MEVSSGRQVPAANPMYALSERLDGSTGIIFLTMKTQTFSTKGFIIERVE